MNRPTQYCSLSHDDSMEIRYLHQIKKRSVKDLMQQFPQYSQRSIQRHAVKPSTDMSGDRRKGNGYKKEADNAANAGNRKTVVDGVRKAAHLCGVKCGVKKKVKNRVRVPIDTSVYMRVLHQELGMQGNGICTIDKTIESMNKRIEMVIKAKGQRIKY
jgi:hypothetical protein